MEYGSVGATVVGELVGVRVAVGASVLVGAAVVGEPVGASVVGEALSSVGDCVRTGLVMLSSCTPHSSAHSSVRRPLRRPIPPLPAFPSATHPIRHAVQYTPAWQSTALPPLPQP
jgi:hypothetical protein